MQTHRSLSLSSCRFAIKMAHSFHHVAVNFSYASSALRATYSHIHRIYAHSFSSIRTHRRTMACEYFNTLSLENSCLMFTINCISMRSQCISHYVAFPFGILSLTTFTNAFQQRNGERVMSSEIGVYAGEPTTKPTHTHAVMADTAEGVVACK